MRTVPFQSVYEGVLRRHGLDPLDPALGQDTARTIADKIQKRMRRALRAWNFLEWSTTEERAFRTVWNSTRQFYRSNPATGKADELFYIPGPTYYRVKSTAPIDPPVGTVPTVTDYFEVLTPVDTYLELDQTCKHSIGRMLGVFPTNPRLNGCGRHGLRFRPSEKGIDVYGTPGPTVFISYMLPDPHYTKRPYIPGKTYNPGDRVFQPLDGNVYRARTTSTNQVPPNVTYWILEPVLETLAIYVEAGAYADCLRATVLEMDPQTRMAQVQLNEAEAADVLEQEIDTLQAQGQISYYNFGRYCNYWCNSQPWPGGAVTTLSDQCESDVSYPPQSPQPGKIWEWHDEVTSLALLKALTTSLWLVGSRVEVQIPLQPTSWILQGGPADVTDPGQQAPNDYGAVANNKHWEAWR